MRRANVPQAAKWARSMVPRFWKALPEHELKILSHVFNNRTIQVSEAARLTGRTWATSKKDLTKRVARGFLDYIPGSYNRDPSAIYVLRDPRQGPASPEAVGTSTKSPTGKA